MEPWFDVQTNLEKTVRKAVGEMNISPTEFDASVRLADPRFGDFQVNGSLSYAKKNQQNPREVATRIIEQLKADNSLDEILEISIAGPGFINFTLKPTFLLNWLKAYSSEEHLKTGSGELYRDKTFVVDFSSPNAAKQMHVGHIRTIVIGEAICRMLSFCGANVIRDNHMGDWGTQYGKILYGYKRFLDSNALAADPLEELERLYKKANAVTEENPEALNEARQELVQLQNGDPQSIALWEKVNELSLEAIEKIYQKLDVHFDHYLGESFYRDKVEQVYDELTELKIAEESKGALVVFHPEHRRFATQPFIIRKSDGASNYASTDLATMLYRTEHFKTDHIIIITDSRQADHFEQLDLTTQKWFKVTNRKLPHFHHVTFGTILGEDGKAIKTRSGDSIRLKELLVEAEDRAHAIVNDKNPDLPPKEAAEIASAVGIGALIYADLSQNRTGDYVFAWDKLLSLEGNTAPYLLYAAARIHSIFRKAGIDASSLPLEEITELDTPEEQNLARKLIAFVSNLNQTATSLRPHILCTYLYELAGVFSSFYNNNKVLVDDNEIKARRLLLCHRTLIILETGLHLLSIRTLKRM
jgi:arginyl-tRNA synthetase